MELNSYGRNFYEGYQMPVKLMENEDFGRDRGYGERLRIIIVQEGTGILEIDKKKFPLISPSILCINEKEKISLEKSNNLKACSVYFHPSVINSSLNFENIRRNSEMHLSTSTVQDIYMLDAFLNREIYTACISIGPNTLRRMSYLYNMINLEIQEQRDSFWPCRSRSFLIEMLYLIRRTGEINTKAENLSMDYSQNNEDIINDVIFYLYSNYSNKITINDLMNMFHINRTSLMEKFNRSTGSTIMNYLSKIRINVAAMILRDTTIPVSEVIERVGFNDMSHFGRMFKKYLGCSPSEYRQKYCWMMAG